MPTTHAGAEPAAAPSGGGSPAGRAGRNLPVAIAIGLVLGAMVLGSIYTYKPAFVGVVALFMLLGAWELVQALKVRLLHVPYAPLAAGGLATLLLAYLRGSEAMVVATLLTAVALTLWRVAEDLPGLLPDLAASLFALAYVPFLMGIAVLLLVPADGPDRVATFVATVVCSDVGGYVAGVLFGKHPMAPTISPKKTWEGFVGSTVACAGAGAAFLPLLLDGKVWQGVVFGVAVVCAAVLGDLGESLLKRDIGIKDMGTLLPGHGGVLDRIDALLITAPVAWLLLNAFVPS